METFKYINLYTEEEMYRWTTETSVYFRHMPYALDLMILYTMSFLQMVNNLYNFDKSSTYDELGSDEMYDMAKNNFRDNYNKAYVTVMNVLKSIFGILFICGIGLAIYLQGIVETNLISWLFFVQFVLVFANMVRADG